MSSSNNETTKTVPAKNATPVGVGPTTKYVLELLEEDDEFEVRFRNFFYNLVTITSCC